MRLVFEVIGMLDQGIPLSGCRMSARRGQPLRISSKTFTIRKQHNNGCYIYGIIESSNPDAECETFEDAEVAVRAFARKVGWTSVSSVLAQHRYHYLFPNGSSLEWRREAKTEPQDPLRLSPAPPPSPFITWNRG